MAPKPKVTAEQIGKVRRLWAASDSLSVKQVADLLGISKSQAGRIMLMQQWAKDKEDAEKLGCGTVPNFTGTAVPPETRATAPNPSPSPSPTLEPDHVPTRASVVLSFPDGFPRPTEVASEVVGPEPVRVRPAGLVSAFPGLPDVIRSPRSEQARIRALSDERARGVLERRRQRLLAVDAAIVKALKTGDPKAATAALNLAKANQVAIALEREFIEDERQHYLDEIARGRDLSTPPEQARADPVAADDDGDYELEAEIRAKANGTWNPTNNLPPGWK